MEEKTISIEKRLREQLNGYPSCFQTFDCIQKIRIKRIKKILAKVKSERDVSGYRGLREDERDLNLIAYLSFVVGKYDDAHKYNLGVLEKNENSISAIVSKAWYHLHNSEFSETQKQCSRLEALRNSTVEITYAKAEQAYICTRLGTQFYKEAERLFNEILADSAETEIPDYEICLWKFGLALIIKRQLNFSNLHSGTLGSLDCDAHRCNQVLELFRDVTWMGGENIDVHRARAYVAIGDFIDVCVFKDQTKLIHKEIIDSIYPRGDFKQKIKFCFETALTLHGTDVFVLERAGKHFRVTGQVDKSIELCERAIQIRETSISHHYLALALKKKLEEDAKPNRSNPQIDQYSLKSNTFKANLRTGWQSQLIKSPKKPFPLQADTIDAILFHLQRSFELGENCSALYDKGLVLRAASKYNEALSVFKTIFRNEACSLVNLCNAYEQSALCLQDQSETSGLEVNRDEESTNVDIKEYFLRAIQIQCNIIAKQPSLKNGWYSIPTYRRLMEDKPYLISNRSELGRFHQMVQDYSEAISCFKQVLELESDGRGRANALIDIIKTCVNAGYYDEAIVHLDMFQCLPECGIPVDDSLYFEAHIEGGLLACSTEEMEIARLRIKNALNYRRRATEDSFMHDNADVHEQDCSGPGDGFDVLVLCDQDSEAAGRNITGLLDSLGLETTLNDDNAVPNLLRMEGMANVIKSSTHCIIVLGNTMGNMSSIKLYANMMKDTNDARSYGNIVVIKENGTVCVDTMLTGFTSMLNEDVDTYTEEHKPWIKDLLWRLASGTEYEQK